MAKYYRGIAIPDQLTNPRAIEHYVAIIELRKVGSLANSHTKYPPRPSTAIGYLETIGYALESALKIQSRIEKNSTINL